jgi:hypothetical protein
MHGNARKYKEQVKDYNDSRQQQGKEAKIARFVEMDNFQDPQVRKQNCWLQFYFILLMRLLLLFR